MKYGKFLHHRRRLLEEAREFRMERRGRCARLMAPLGSGFSLQEVTGRGFKMVGWFCILGRRGGDSFIPHLQIAKDCVLPFYLVLRL